MASGDEADRFAALRTFAGQADAARLYAGPLAESRRAGDPASALIADAYRRSEGSALRRMRYADIETYLADDLLPKVDVATMAHGLEARAPLLDHEVVRFALSLPDEHLIDGGGGKRPLRALLKRYVPAELFERPKQGFSVPLPRWFAGDVRKRLDAMASSERFAELGWFRPHALAHVVEEHASGVRENSQRLFSLLMLDEWLKSQ
jgi:asparagine synthase (glutamine-hydrolysing)